MWVAAAQEEEGGVRYRLILLEGNWTYATKMASYLKGRVTGLRSVCLGEEVVGTYWRFQSVGVSALSTIEALYHACKQARPQLRDEEEQGRLDHLLVLFELPIGATCFHFSKRHPNPASCRLILTQSP